MTKRKFYRTVIQVTVLSEEPFEYENLSQVKQALEESGDCSGDCKTVETCELNGKQTAKALQEQGSDPEFFQIDENGNDWNIIDVTIESEAP